MIVYVDAREWWAVPVPYTEDLDDLRPGAAVDIPDDIVRRWQTAATEFLGACRALAAAGGWPDTENLGWQDDLDR